MNSDKFNRLKGTRSYGMLQHGHNSEGSHSATYNSWMAMKARCNNPNNSAYPHYGGRGMYVDPMWNEFENFLSDMGERPYGMTLERKDNDGPYAPWNCKWATRKEQSNNQRQRKDAAIIEINGISKTRTAWARETGIRASTLRWRVRRGILGPALLAPVQSNRNRDAVDSDVLDTYTITKE